MSQSPRHRDAELAAALELAALARPIVLRHFRKGVTVDAKDDASPVTIADRDAEAAMRDVIGKRFPSHGILGEEHGSEGLDRDFVWVLDPIDGTKSFITGKPLFGTLIGLAFQGVPVLGVIDMPALGETYVGADDRGASFNGEPIRTRPCAALDQAMLYATSPDQFRGADQPRFARVSARTRHTLYGADCFHYAMLSAGWSDLVVEAQLKPYDFCAPAAVVKAAGGAVADWEGRELTIHSDGRVAASGDPARLQDLLACLKP